MEDLKKIQEFFSKPLKEEINEAMMGAEEAIQKFYGDKIQPDTLKLDWSLPGGKYTAKNLKGEDIYFDMGRHHFRVFRIEDWYDHVQKVKGIPMASSEYQELKDEFDSKKLDYVLFGLPGRQPEMEESVNEMEFGDPVDAVFRKYAGKTIEMDFEDMESDWANLLNDLEDYFPGDKLSDFMDSGEADLYLDDYNITLMEPIMDKEVDLDVLKRAKAKMDIDKMRYDAGMPPMDSIASLNEDEDIDTEYRAILDKFKDIMKGLDVKEADALQQKLKAYFAGLDENMKKSFTDYTNQELATYVKNTKDKEAAKELHKRSQALKNLSRTDNSGDDDNDEFFDAAKLRALNKKHAYKAKTKKQAAILNPVDTEIAREKAMFGLEENKPVANVNKHIKAIQIQLQQLGVKYEMSGNPYKPFKAVYKPVNKDDKWYKNFDDIIFRYNLGGVVKTSMDEATKEEETEFHTKLDKLVHDTFGKRKGELEEAFVPSNIKDFAKRRGVSRLVNTVAGWAEKVGARITGGTAIGKNYNTLILDLGYQTADIRINVEDETIELYNEPIYSFADFKRVFIDEVTRNQIEHDEEQLRRERGLEEIKQRVFNRLKK